MAEKVLTNRFFYEKFLKDKDWIKKIPQITSKIKKYIDQNNCKTCLQPVKVFISNFKRRWIVSGRNRLFFEKKYANWLDQGIPLKKSLKRKSYNNSIDRKVLPFEDLSNSQKRRRTASVRKENIDSLAFATASSLRENRKFALATLLDEGLKTPSRAEKILKSYRRTLNNDFLREMNGEEALKFALDSSLTKNQYLRIRENSKLFGATIYPSYQKLLHAKNLCYPEDIKVDNNSIYCPLQSLLDHTGCRFLLFLNKDNLCKEIIILYKLGFDGSSGQSEFRHISEKESAVSDGSVYITTIVPIRVIEKQNQCILWQNPCPSSTRYCRPVRIAYEKESLENIKTEYIRIKNEITNLEATNINFIYTKIEHIILITMLDCKSINAIVDNKSTQMCYICKSTSNNMNNMESRNVIPCLQNDEILKYGISPLHARIKFMEFILHLSYRLDLPVERRKKGTRLTTEERKVIENRKRYIQENFKKRLNLLVDVPKQGFGSSNNGNTSRRFFDKNLISAEITGIEHQLIYNFFIILIVLNSSHEIDEQAFAAYTLKTTLILIEKYNWWTMSPTVHKVLVHGHHIISKAILPLGQLSEEAQEHRNKDFKSFKSNFSRRCSRKGNLQDIFNRFLITSDPHISHLRETTKLKSIRKDLPEDAQNLLKKIENVKSTSDIEKYESEDEEI